MRIATTNEATNTALARISGMLGVLLLLAWLFHYVMGLAAGVLETSLLILGIVFLTLDFLWSQVRRIDD